MRFSIFVAVFRALFFAQFLAYAVAVCWLRDPAGPASAAVRSLAYLVPDTQPQATAPSVICSAAIARPGLGSLPVGRETDDELLTGSAAFGKRALDVVVASFVLIVFAVLFVPIALAIKLESKGPVFYRQLRVGLRTPRQSRLFHLTKFRTMRTDAESKSGAVWATERDPRITRVGYFLRKTRLDELPQCIDVLRGDMSVVGPRPERPQFFTMLESEIPFYAERTYGVKPGITGLAQVFLPYDSSIEDVRAKVLHDHAYALRLMAPGRWLTTDLGIMLRTF